MIFYFSGTGNTKFVAKEIAAGIGEDLLFIPDLIRGGRYEFALQPGETVHHPTPIIAGLLPLAATIWARL